MKFGLDPSDTLDSLSAFPPLPGSVHDNEAEWQLRCSLFPDVPLEERLQSWRPGVHIPLPLRTSSGVDLGVNKFLSLAVSKTLRGGLEWRTRYSYGSSLGTFVAFCFSLGLGARDIFPVSEGLLLAYVASCTGNRAVGTVKNVLTAVKTWHLMWGQRWTRYDLVGQALKGVAKHAPDARPLRPPVEPVDLLAARAFLDPTNDPLHAAVWAACLVSFFCCCRLSETTTPPARFVDASRHVMRSRVGPVREVGGRKALVIDLPWTKTTGTAGMRKVVSEGRGLLEPVGALQWHLRVNSLDGADDGATPLFSYKVRCGRGWRLAPLTKDVLVNTFARALASAGRPAFTGHSFRIGGGTFYWHRGATEAEVKALGGWASDCYKVYLRDELRGVAPAQQRLLGPGGA